MKNTPTCSLYKVSAMDMVRLLWYNTGNSIHITKHLRMYTGHRWRLVPSKLMQEVDDNGMEKMIFR
jgi:hypothetical protein